MSYKKFTKDMGLFGLTQLIAALYGIITLPVITKILGVKDYGVWTQLMVTISLLAPVASLSLPYAMVRFLAGEKNKKEIQDGIWSVFVIILGTASVIALFLFMFSGPISIFFDCPAIFIQFLAVIIIIDFLNGVFLNIFRTFQQITKYSFFAIFQKVGEAGMIIFMILSGYGLLGALLSILIIRSITFLTTGILIIKDVGLALPKFLRIKKYFFFALPNIFSDVAFWVVQSSDKYLIGLFLGTLSVGYYSPAYTLGSCIAILATPLIFLLPATLSSHYDNNQLDEVKNYLKHSLKYFMALAIPASFGISILSKKLLSLFSTQEIANNSYYLVPLIALSSVFYGAYVIMAQIIALKNKTYIVGIIWTSSAIINTCLNFIFIPMLGIFGAAIATLLAYFIIFIFIWIYSFKEIKFEIDWKFILKSFLASLLMSFGVLALNPAGMLKTLVTIATGAIIYFIFMFLLRAFDKNEYVFLTSFFS